MRACHVTVAAVCSGMRIIASSNIIAEDLHNTRNLETPFYFPDMTQAFDFRWERGSDINVHIGLFNMHLIPKYTDVTHKSDNLYMETNPSLDLDLSNFRNIRHNFCRYSACTHTQCHCVSYCVSLCWRHPCHCVANIRVIVRVADTRYRITTAWRWRYHVTARRRLGSSSAPITTRRCPTVRQATSTVTSCYSATSTNRARKRYIQRQVALLRRCLHTSVAQNAAARQLTAFRFTAAADVHSWVLNAMHISDTPLLTPRPLLRGRLQKSTLHLNAPQ